MNDTFTFHMPALELAKMIGMEKKPHNLRIEYGGLYWELGDFEFIDGIVNAANGSVLVGLRKVIQTEPAENVVSIESAKA